jgi:hypothetical protein
MERGRERFDQADRVAQPSKFDVDPTECGGRVACARSRLANCQDRRAKVVEDKATDPLSHGVPPLRFDWVEIGKGFTSIADLGTSAGLDRVADHLDHHTAE